MDTWQCRSCDWLNYDIRSQCHNCRAPRPEQVAPIPVHDDNLAEAMQDEAFAEHYKHVNRPFGRSWEDIARTLSGRLRQMDKRARAANARADRLEQLLTASIEDFNDANAARLAMRDSRDKWKRLSVLTVAAIVINPLIWYFWS